MRSIQEYKNRWAKVWPVLLIGALLSYLNAKTGGWGGWIVFVAIMGLVFYLSLK